MLDYSSTGSLSRFPRKVIVAAELALLWSRPRPAAPKRICSGEPCPEQSRRIARQGVSLHLLRNGFVVVSHVLSKVEGLLDRGCHCEAVSAAAIPFLFMPKHKNTNTQTHWGLPYPLVFDGDTASAVIASTIAKSFSRLSRHQYDQTDSIERRSA